MDLIRHPLAYARLARPLSTIARNRKLQLRFLPPRDYLNLGCAGNTKPEFINLDWTLKPGINLCWDMTRPLPLGDKSLAGAYTEHAVEHISLDDARGLFKEICRILKEDGVFRVVVPDAGEALEQYHRGIANSIPAPGDGTWMMKVNRVFRSFGHQYAWDFETMQQELIRAGFLKVERCEFNEGRDPALLIDSERRRGESMYVEASAPP